MQYKGTQKTVRQIAEELGVSAILEGGVQKSGETVRINAQLINAGTDEHIWADNYDRSIKDLFAIQSEVAQQVAQQLDIKLNTNQKDKLNKEPTKNKEAYEHYLKATDFQINS
jgi:TolB-like protein